MTPRRLARGPVRKLRVCVFSHFLNFTGAPLIQYELAAALMRSGVIEPVVACVPDGPLKQWYEKLGIEVHVLGENPLAPALARPEAYEPSIDALGRRMKEEWKVDVVWANTLDTVFAVDAASRTGLPVVWNIHESEGWRADFGSVCVMEHGAQFYFLAQSAGPGAGKRGGVGVDAPFGAAISWRGGERLGNFDGWVDLPAQGADGPCGRAGEAALVAAGAGASIFCGG